jgi:hypothetical protein
MRKSKAKTASATSDSGGTDHRNEITEVFEALPSRFRRGRVDNPTSFCFSIDDQEWTVIVETDRCSVTKGTLDAADCSLKTSGDIFLGTIRGTYKPGIADLVNGRIKTNNPILLQTFRDIFG